MKHLGQNFESAHFSYRNPYFPIVAILFCKRKAQPCKQSVAICERGVSRLQAEISKLQAELPTTNIFLKSTSHFQQNPI